MTITNKNDWRWKAHRASSQNARW